MINSIKDTTTLNNGLKMPWLGLGLYKLTSGQEMERAVRAALEAGYRSFDTATFYQNERSVGKALRESGIPREEIFLTTKIWNDAQREKRTMASFEKSLENLGADTIDLFLVHWPVEGFFKQTWRVLEEIYQGGRAKAIGVSNFLVHHLEDLLPVCNITPAINQVEFHPYLFQAGLLRFCREHGIQLEAWSPIMKGRVTDNKTIRELAQKYQRTPAQITLRWELQHGVVVIPKSANPKRILENANIFDFELSPQDMRTMDALDQGLHIGPHPDTFDF